MPGWSGSDRRSRLPADWAKRRKRILARDHYRCQHRRPDGSVCGASANQVDHRVAGDDDSDANLISLCEAHHAMKSSSEGGRAVHRGARRRPRVKPWRREAKHPGMR